MQATDKDALKREILDHTVSLGVMSYLPVLRGWPLEWLQPLASGCADIIGTYADAMMYPDGKKPKRLWIWPAGLMVDHAKPPEKETPKRYVPGPEPGKFMLKDAPDARPLWPRAVTVGQAIALGLCAGWLQTPANAKADAYGPAEMFPEAAAMFRWLQAMEGGSP